MDIFSNIKSIAIIGSSNNPKKLGFDITKNVIDYGFPGNIYPINLREENILNLRTYKSITDVSDTIDLAVIAIPSTQVPSELEKCVKKHVGLVIIISSGFKEIGPEGKILEDKLKGIIENSNTRVIGPNCLGIISSKNKINASFAKSLPKADLISFISQSGALGAAFLDWAGEHNLGINNFVSIGNKMDLDENFFLENLENDDVIACYLEHISDGKRLMELGYKHNKNRPVIILKPGESEEANKAISSHTGSLSGGHIPISTGLKQSGYIEVETIGELFNMTKAFAWQPLPNNNKVAIVTNAGGPAVIATDLLIKNGLELARLSEKIKDSLKSSLPRQASIKNPVDVIGDALSDRYKTALEDVLKDENVSAVIVILTPQIMTEIEKTTKIIGEMKKYGKTILASFIGGTLVENGIKFLSNEKIPAYHFPETAVSVLASMYSYSKFKQKSISITKEEKKSKYYSKSHLEIMEYYLDIRNKNEKAFSPDIAEKIARLYGINTPISYECSNFEEAKYHLKTKVKYPCVLKISSPNIIHKTDIHGIITDISSDKVLRESFEKLESIIQNKKIQDAKIEIQTYFNTGIYGIIGASRNDSFGNILIFGSGGIYTEIINDVSRRITPINKEIAMEMINETKMSKIFYGYRQQNMFNLKPIVKAIMSVQSLIDDYPFIKSIDINPLVIDINKSFAVDIKILV